MTTDFSIYTKLVIDEAKKRGLEVKTFKDLSRNLVILKNNKHQEVLSQVSTDLVGSATAKLVDNKIVINQILKEQNFPTPDNIFTHQLQKAVEYLQKKGKLVVKPLGLAGGKGITTNITDKPTLKKAFLKAQNLTRSHTKKVICQEFINGNDHRLTVIDQQYFYAVKREPAFIIGDGQNTIGDLIADWNQALPVKARQIRITSQLKDILKKQALSLKSVPQKDRRIKLGQLANAHAGGIVTDITTDVPTQTKQMAIEIAQRFSLPAVGIDIISPDITQDAGKIIELNSYPGLTLHHFPSIGKPRNPTAKIIEMLFPELKNQ